MLRVVLCLPRLPAMKKVIPKIRGNRVVLFREALSNLHAPLRVIG